MKKLASLLTINGLVPSYGYSSILKYRSYRSYTKFLNKIFTYIQKSTQCGYGLTKLRMKKCILFHEEVKT